MSDHFPLLLVPRCLDTAFCFSLLSFLALNHASCHNFFVLGRYIHLIGIQHIFGAFVDHFPVMVILFISTMLFLDGTIGAAMRLIDAITSRAISKYTTLRSLTK